MNQVVFKYHTIRQIIEEFNVNKHEGISLLLRKGVPELTPVLRRWRPSPSLQEISQQYGKTFG